MSIREEILESMARTLFVTAYADACDEYDSGDTEGEDLRFSDTPRAGGGEDWMDVAPDVGRYSHAAADARALAARMLKEFGRLNKRAAGSELSIEGYFKGLRDEWCASTGHDAQTFGHYIAMQSLGSGVGLNDDTGPGCREWKTGYFEGINL